MTLPRLLARALGCLGLVAAGAWGGPDLPPNFVLFVVDDLGWRDLGCQGSDYYQTPNIDRLASRGIRFPQAYAACALCSPTRASLLTGKSPARLLLTQWLPAGRWDPQMHRMREGRFLRSLPLEEITLAEALREAGYATFHVGKWHLGGPPFSLPEQHGFDVNIAGSEHGAPGSYFSPYRGTWTIPTTGQDVLKQTLPGGEEGDYLTDRLTEEAVHLLRQSRNQPFFLYFPYYAVHTPLQAKKGKLQSYQKVPRATRQGKPAYAAMVETVDDSLGRILETLDDLGLRDSTVVAFTSDNGGHAHATSNAPLRANKGSHYEGGIRVPLILQGPGIEKQGAVDSTPVISHDLYPTILELAGLPLRPHQHVDGLSLVPLLQGEGRLERDALFWHYPHYNRHPQSAPVSVMRLDSWKLIEFLETGRLELYDLDADPRETENLAAREPDLTRRLLTRLVRWKRECGADPMKANPHFEP